MADLITTSAPAASSADRTRIAAEAVVSAYLRDIARDAQPLTGATDVPVP